MPPLRGYLEIKRLKTRRFRQPENFVCPKTPAFLKTPKTEHAKIPGFQALYLQIASQSAIKVGQQYRHLVCREGNDIRISARTDTKENSVSTMAEMRGGGDDNKREVSEENKKKIQDATTGLFASIDSADANSKQFEKFGLAGAVSFTYDDVATRVIIGGTEDGIPTAAHLIAGGDIEISAETINQIASSAFALIGEYKAGDEEINKEKALAISTPIVFMNNVTEAIVGAGSNIIAGGTVDITANTRIPFNPDASDNADIVRIVNSRTLSGAAGFTGLGAAVSVINMGGSVDPVQQRMFEASVLRANEMASAANGTSVGNLAQKNVDGGSATLRIGGSLTTN